MTFDDLQVSDLAWIRAIAGLTQAQAAERLGDKQKPYAGTEAGSIRAGIRLSQCRQAVGMKIRSIERSRFCSLYGL